MNFIELCNEVGPWATKNFGNDRRADDPLLGVLEEIGEISHSYLKSLQGIRGTQEEHREAMRDGVGDAVVFLADFCYRADIVKSFVGRTEMNHPFDKFSFDIRNYSRSIVKIGPRYFLFKAAREVDRIFDYYCTSKVEPVSFGIYVEMLLHNLVGFCWMTNFNFAECVMTTWAIVSQRDWTKNKQTGEV